MKLGQSGLDGLLIDVFENLHDRTVRIGREGGEKTIDRAVADAKIVISQKDQRILADTSGKDGKLAAPLLPGSYTVVVTKAGFKPTTVQVDIAAKDVNKEIVLTASAPPGK